MEKTNKNSFPVRTGRNSSAKLVLCKLKRKSGVEFARRGVPRKPKDDTPPPHFPKIDNLNNYIIAAPS